MSLSANTLVKAVKRAALDAVMAANPMAIDFGVVISNNPLKISVDQKLTLRETQLMLTSSVRDYTVEMTVDHSTENISSDDEYLSHNHAYKGRKKFTVHQGLKKGEKVLLLRCDGGQKFIVLDRVEVLA